MYKASLFAELQRRNVVRALRGEVQRPATRLAASAAQHDPRFTAFCKKVGLPTTTEAKALPAKMPSRVNAADRAA